MDNLESKLDAIRQRAIKYFRFTTTYIEAKEKNETYAERLAEMYGDYKISLYKKYGDKV